MNKNIHRIIFNTVREQWMVVPENATAQGRSSSASGERQHEVKGRTFFGSLSILKLSLLLSFGMASLVASAQITPDAAAPAQQQPGVANAANGVPVVNIQTPSAAGVSRNTYQQFDVKANGVVLNNSAGNVQSQLGGWIQGNPLLAGGNARVILNEVNSSNPSLLHGFIEVAGSRAQVIVANPAGISCDGCGFINAERATLTTGTPVFSNGNLESFRVERGTVSFTGAGMDASQTDYTRVLARAVQVNAGIWAKQLEVVTGANEVRAEPAGEGAQSLEVTPLAASADQPPAFSIDVSQLGGMYAGKIRLVGTEAGLGVRNAGKIGATAGNVFVDSQGRLTNSGSIQASEGMELVAAGGLSNSGTLYAGHSADLQLAGSNDNAGLIGAANNVSITARSDVAGHAGSFTQSSTATLAAGLAAEMSLGSNGELVVSADTVQMAGQIAAGASQSWQGRVLSLQGSSILTKDFSLTADAANLDSAVLSSQGSVRITARDSLTTRAANLQAQRLALAAVSLDNTGGQLIQNGNDAFSLNLAGALNNIRGVIATAGAFDLRTGALSNTSGTLYAGASLTVTSAGVLNNDRGSILSAGSAPLTLHTPGDFSNVGGQVSANGELVIQALKLTNTESGELSAGGASAITVHTLDNSGGRIQSDQSLRVETQATLLNNSGKLLAGTSLTLESASIQNQRGSILNAGSGGLSTHVSGALDNTEGEIAGNGDADIEVAGLDNRRGRINAQGALALNSSGGLNNTDGHITQTGLGLMVVSASQGFINTRGTLASNAAQSSLSGSTLNNAGGSIRLGGDLSLQFSSVVNDSGLLSASGKLQLVQADLLQNRSGKILASSDLALEATQLDNQSGEISSATGALSARSSALSNASGTLSASGRLQLLGGGVNNNAGVISAHEVALDTQGASFDNVDGRLVSGSSLSLVSARLDNTRGTLQAAGNTDIDTRGAELINRDSGSQNGILSGGALSLKVGALDNRSGFIGGNLDASLTLTGLDNTRGTINAQRNIDLSTGVLTNTTGGQVNALGNISVRASSLNNDDGLLRSNNTLDITTTVLTNRNTQSQERGLAGSTLILNTGSLDNSAGAIRAAQQLSFTSSGTLQNAGGVIQSSGQATLTDAQAGRTLAISNTGGNILASQRLTLESGSYSGGGTLASYGDLSFSVQGDYTHTGIIQGMGNVTISVQNLLSNQSLLEAGQTLSVRAGAIDNTQSGEFNGATTHLYSAGTLNNRGLIDGGLTWLEQVQLNNLGSGRIYGDQVSIRTGGLSNDAETGGDGQTRAAVIAARSSLQIGAGSLDNGNHALLFSAGNLAIGGDLNASQQAVGQAGNLNNHSATIEALGDMSLSVQQITNRNDHFATEQVQVSSDYFDLFLLGGATYTAKDNGAYVGSVNGRDNLYANGQRLSTEFDRRMYTETVTETRVTSTDPAVIRAGGSIALASGSITNAQSKLLAGGALTGSVDVITNDGGVGQRTTLRSGTFVQYRNGGASQYAYNENLSADMDLGAVIVEVGSSQGGSGTSLAAREVISLTGSIAAPGDLALGRDGSGSAQGADASTVEGAGVVGGATQAPGRGTVPHQIYEVSTGGNGAVIRTTAPNIRLPDNSLFRLIPAAQANYLIETDPRFASYKTWLSSDAMISALGLDPALTQKRLGDGFYEQKLVREQISELTGQRFLEGYASDEAQYQALMDKGVSFAKQYQLIPGVALSAEQMALLTSDIVWLVEQSVTLPDGSTTRVLVPQVYARAQSGDIDGSGALIAARDVQIKLSGALANNGTLAASKSLAITADSISQTGGRMSANTLELHAANDIQQTGGLISGTQSVVLDAGRNVVIASTSRSSASGEVSNTYINRLSGIQVGVAGQEGGQLIISGRQDVALTAATLSNLGTGGSTLIAAGRNLTLDTLTTSRDERLGSGGNHHYESSRTEQGTVIQSAGSVQLQAGNDLAARAATVSAGEALTVVAGNDIRIQAGEATRAVDDATVRTSKGLISSSTLARQSQTLESTALGSDFQAGGALALSAGRDLNITASNLAAQGDATLYAGRDLSLGAQAYNQSSAQTSHSSKRGVDYDVATGANYNTRKLSENFSNLTTRQTGSSVSGDNVSLSAGRDATITASNVLADRDLAVEAGRNVDILAAVETSRTQTATQSSGFGLNVYAGMAPRQTFIGTNRAADNGTQYDTNGVTSILSANAGNLSIRAGLDKNATDGQSAAEAGRVLTQGANIQAQGNVDISGRSVSLEEVNTTSQSSYHTQSSSMTLGAQLAGSVGSIITAAYDNAQAARKTDNDRLKGALVLKSVYDIAKLGQSAADGKLGSAAVVNSDQVDGAGGKYSEADVNNGKADSSSGSAFGVSVNLTSGSSKSDSINNSSTARGTNIQGDKISITASDGDLHAKGVKIQGTDVSLEASRNILLEAASNTSTLDNTNSGANYGLGVTVGLGSQNGISFQISASQSRGMASGSETTYDNSLIEASNRLTLKSGGDTTLSGAQLKAKEVSGNIGGDLKVVTLQDS
ncbi:hemagglutinin repeat-containing protein, partial [Uliginosibacterium sp. 31-12]|uniref:two-partner secretion domain-containing protein n=1 Tax=Uliginosibacterium sp. 31-12 TaxID=3062781 RepID=UPI0026E29AF5